VPRSALKESASRNVHIASLRRNTRPTSPFDWSGAEMLPGSVVEVAQGLLESFSEKFSTKPLCYVYASRPRPPLLGLAPKMACNCFVNWLDLFFADVRALLPYIRDGYALPICVLQSNNTFWNPNCVSIAWSPNITAKSL